jgi:uncharacterized delta-60 repeat protein
MIELRPAVRPALSLFLLLAAPAFAGTKNLSVTDLVIQSDQKIMFIGNGLGCGYDGKRSGANATAVLARLTADGKIDPTFGAKGYANLSQFEAPAFLPREKGGFWLATTDYQAAVYVTRADAKGESEDPPSKHLLYTSPPGSGGYPRVSKFLPVASGKTLAVIINGDNGVIARFDSEGNLDSEFADAGILSLGKLFARQEVFTAGAVVLSTGEILAQAGSVEDRVGGHTATQLSRYDDAGYPDHGFGSGGSLVLPETSVELLAALPGDKILAFVADYVTRSRRVAVIGSDGKVDPNFGKDGLVALPSPDPATYQVAAVSGARQPDGKILLWTFAYHRSDFRPIIVAYLVRLLANGEFDNSFAHVGYVARNVLPDKSEIPVAMAVDSAGRILTASSLATSSCSTEHPFLVTRTLPDGSLDQSFGVGGYAVP